MIKAWPSRADVIGMSLCVVVLWVSSAAPTMAADDEVWTLRDGTRDVEYERASEEVHLSGPALDRVVSAGPRGPRLSGLGVQEQWVLYPRGQDRTPLNRRVLTHRVIVELVPGADVAAVAREAGVGRWEGFDFSDTHFVLHSARGMASALFSSLLDHRLQKEARTVNRRSIIVLAP